MNKFEEIRQNEPAFPTENARQTGENDYRYSGLTKREYFAAVALQAICSRPGAISIKGIPTNEAKDICAVAITIGDEMLSQLG